MDVVELLLESMSKMAVAIADEQAAQVETMRLKFEIGKREAVAYLATNDDGTPWIDGKNAEIRKAQLSRITGELLSQLVAAEIKMVAARHTRETYEMMHTTFLALLEKDILEVPGGADET